jgi:UDP-N-acetylglucosamine 2-epimerase (non-hydrolysing)
MKFLHVVGARPNFMKAAPVIDALKKYPHVSQLLVHTGQHYDQNMSDIFFKELGLPEPDLNLEVGSGSHALQTAEIMTRFEPILLAERPDWVLVYGDVNSTVATALVATKRHIPVAHVEAGLRSFDRTMPEEINRLLTDQIADLLFTPSADGDENLLREGIAPQKIHLVGNVMIDTLLRLLPQAERRWPALQAVHNLSEYGLVTLHRPSNVDNPAMLPQIMTALHNISREIPLLFPMHPRTRQRLDQLQLTIDEARLTIIPPIGYLDFLALQQNARLIITDSGGIQEESTYLGVPCLTVRQNTERPITITHGTNQLIGQDMALLQTKVTEILGGAAKQGHPPPLWDGRAGERIAAVITNYGKK